MTQYYPDLVTLNYIRTHRDLATAETDDDPFLTQLIHEASTDFINGLLGRVPMPFIDTRQYGSEKREGRDLKVDDLLTVTTVANGDSAVVDASSYNLRPDNVYPKNRIELKSSSGLTWNFNYLEDRVSLTGLFGYVPQYPNQWRLSGGVVPVGDMTTSSTTLTFASDAAAQVFETGQYGQIGSEVIQFTSRDTAIWTHTRAELGTTAATHTAGTAIYAYKQLADILFAVREMVVYYYKTRHEIGARVQVFNNGVLQVQDLNPKVDEIRKRHMLKLPFALDV